MRRALNCKPRGQSRTCGSGATWIVSIYFLAELVHSFSFNTNVHKRRLQDVTRDPLVTATPQADYANYTFEVMSTSVVPEIT